MSKLTPSKGLKLESDNTPLSSTLIEDAELIDSVLYTNATGLYWYYHYSYGLDLGCAETVDSIICRAEMDYTPTDWYSTSHDSVMVYKSDDNSTWTEVEQFDAPPIIHMTDKEFAFELEFATPQTARFFKVRNAESSGTLATSPDGHSLQVSEIEAYGTGGETQLEDVSLDLSAYYQSCEDLATFLRAHDGIELHDLAAKLEAAGWDIEDLAAFLSAWLQGLDDAALDLSTHGFSYEDMRCVLAAYFQSSAQDLKTFLQTWATGYGDLKSMLEAADWNLEDLAAWLCAWAQELSSLTFLLEAGTYGLRDLAAFLVVIDGVVFNDLAIRLDATDCDVTRDVVFVLSVVSGTPAFRSVTAQRVSSIIHEVS